MGQAMMPGPLSRLLRSGPVDALGREALSRLDGETAHRASIMALKLGLVPSQDEPDAPELAGDLCGLAFKNPIGIAAGYDKNAEAPRALAKIGFGIVEVGTLTPRPQAGNARPRVFRLPQAGAVINRMGFNNDGHARALERLAAVRVPGLLGINIGANKDSADFVADYVAGVRTFADRADYLTINVSSPNTPGLRNLQADEALKRLLGEVLAARAKARTRVPVLLKIAPDLDEAGLDGVAGVVLETDLDGLIVSNTTLGREGVAGLEHASETGGLSGRPVFALSTRRLAQMRQRVGALPIIGVGGIHSPETALAKFEAGANAIQIYTGLIYEGPGLIARIKAGLVAAVRSAGVSSVAGLVGTRTADWAEGRL
jgi:dihydroorotate dehydrogenase